MVVVALVVELSFVAIHVPGIWGLNEEFLDGRVVDICRH